jgi:hypothetical protein
MWTATILTYVIVHECITDDYARILSNCKASSFYFWTSEDGFEGPKHVRPY